MAQQELTYPGAASAPRQPLELSLPAQPEWVSVVRLATAGVASRMEFSYDEIEDIKLAVAEACNNAILHAASQDPAALLRVRWAPTAKTLEILIEDDGNLEPHELPLEELDPPGDELAESGMGLILIQALMDEVEQSTSPDGHTVLRLTKYAS